MKITNYKSIIPTNFDSDQVKGVAGRVVVGTAAAGLRHDAIRDANEGAIGQEIRVAAPEVRHDGQTGQHGFGDRQPESFAEARRHVGIGVAEA